MKKLSYLALMLSLIALTGCGGGGSSDSGSTSNQSTANTSDNNSGNTTTNNTKLDCNRGILLNSNMSASSIFDQPLYKFDYEYTSDLNKSYIYANSIVRDQQMLYMNQTAILNTNTDSLTQQEKDNYSNRYVLNASGLHPQSDYQQTSKGWPISYLNASNSDSLTVSEFNNTCDFSVEKVKYNYKTVDLSGKKISDIFPANILNTDVSSNEYIYLSSQLGSILKRNISAFTAFIQSSATFPQGSTIYIPTQKVYDEINISFYDDNVTSYKTLEEWKNATYPQNQYTYKQTNIAGYNVIYPVDNNDNPVYGAGDPAVEMNGKIYDGEWIIKGDILSSDYGAPTNNSYGYVNHDLANEETYFNKTGFDFIKDQIQTYYK